jgi:AcrR family transcriptional regulator
MSSEPIAEPIAPKTRDRILAESLRLFATQGFAGTTVVEIEQASGLAPGRGGFYRHFKDKEAVLHETVAVEIARIAALHAARQTNEPTVGPSDELRAQLAESMEVLAELSDLMLVLAHDGQRFPELLPQVFEVMVEGGVATDAALLQRVIDAGEMPPHDPTATATILLTATVGYSLTNTFFGGPPADTDATTFVATLVDLLTGDPES